MRDPTDLCSDCPRDGYPTDKTRCLPCPRRKSRLTATDLARLHAAMLHDAITRATGPGGEG